MANEIFARFKADEYIKGEAEVGDVLNAVDLDKAFGNQNAKAVDAITDAVNRELIREAGRSVAGGALDAFGFCIMSDGFYKLLYIIGAFVFPFLMPYVFYNFLLGDRERMYGGLLGAPSCCFLAGITSLVLFWWEHPL